jgi:hypothetical protein
MQIRLITDLLPYLLPGIQVDFPHRSVEFNIAATALPNVSFSSATGMATATAFDVRVYVLPLAGVATGSAEPASGLQTAKRRLPVNSTPVQPPLSAEHVARLRQGDPAGAREEVAHLSARVSANVEVAFKGIRFSGENISFSVVQSRYDVDAVHWEETTRFVLQQLQEAWGLEALVKAFAGGAVLSSFAPHKVAADYLDGWYLVSTNVRINASGLLPPAQVDSLSLGTVDGEPKEGLAVGLDCRGGELGHGMRDNFS